MGLPPAGRHQQCPHRRLWSDKHELGSNSSLTGDPQSPMFSTVLHGTAPQEPLSTTVTHTRPHKNPCLASPCSQSSSHSGGGTFFLLLWLSVILTCSQEILWPHQPGTSEATVSSGHSITGSSVLAWHGTFSCLTVVNSFEFVVCCCCSPLITFNRFFSLR